MTKKYYFFISFSLHFKEKENLNENNNENNEDNKIAPRRKIEYFIV